jgi:hypothetical protein
MTTSTIGDAATPAAKNFSRAAALGATCCGIGNFDVLAQPHR